MRDLRIRAGLKATRLAREAEVSPSTIHRIERAVVPTTPEMVQSVLNVLNRRLGTDFSIEDIEGLKFGE